MSSWVWAARNNGAGPRRYFVYAQEAPPGTPLLDRYYYRNDGNVRRFSREGAERAAERLNREGFTGNYKEGE